MTDASKTDAPDVEALRERIERALGTALEEKRQTILDEWADGPPSRLDAVRAAVARLRDRLLDDLRDIEEREALKQCIALQYLEVKCHWAALTTRIQERAATEAAVSDSSLLYRATCTSLLVQRLEPFLSPDRLSDLTDTLGESDQ